ncbi:MAG: histidine phosphatase family protein [Candidatus Gracilibacteria bacterium]
MKVAIIRHGETENNKLEVFQSPMEGQLTKEGIEGAEKLGLRFKDEVFTIIYSSDSKRAKDTVEKITQYHPGTPLEYVELLRERNCGALIGRPKSELDLDNLPADYETDTMMRVRAKEFKVTYLDPYKETDQYILISTHGAFSRMLMTELYESPDKHPNNVGGISNTGVTEFEYFNDIGWEKTLDNDVSHLNK